jgi:hypothetical protein
MLALGILTVHVALDTRVGSRIEAGFRVSESEEVEYIVTFEAVVVVLERIMGSGTPLDPAPVGCAYPFPLATVLLVSKGYRGFVNADGTGPLLSEVTPEELVMAVTLEYGAEWLD